MKRRTLILVAAIAAALQSPPDLNAQTENGQDPMKADPCKSGTKGRAGRPARERPGPGGKLDRCNGVLRPPPTEDHEIEEPPPDIGRTPVVPPGALPEQQPEPE